MAQVTGFISEITYAPSTDAYNNLTVNIVDQKASPLVSGLYLSWGYQELIGLAHTQALQSAYVYQYSVTLTYSETNYITSIKLNANRPEYTNL